MEYKKLYEKMLLIRRFEECVAKLYRLGEVAGFCHLYIGQEAIVTGIKENLNEYDYMITSYRCHGHMVASDVDLGPILAELCGKETGTSQGKGGSMHLFSKKHRFMGGHGIVGTTAPLGTGMAFAQKYKKTNGITVAFMGDGAMNQGQVFESFNISSLWNIPVLYIIEDNGYAIGTAKERSTAGIDLFKRAQPFGIEAKKADGMDLDEVLKVARWGVNYVRENSKPALIQLDTYRFKGHSMSDATRLYRTKEEEKEKTTNYDCLSIIANRYNFSAKDIEAIEQRVAKKVEEALAFAQSSKLPESKQLMQDIYR